MISNALEIKNINTLICFFQTYCKSELCQPDLKFLLKCSVLSKQKDAPFDVHRWIFEKALTPSD